ncbi:MULTISPECIES: hypothetical protein [unclassified Agrococcus]|uniref:hypothetical protein n=1 Tax=unclassified Agrococcus TaxID=2615065 RepID=UPI00360F6674
MHIAPVPDADPSIAAVRAAARASLQALGDDLVAATGAARDAASAVPTTTLAWAGIDAEAFAGVMERLRADALAVRDALSTASAIVASELA